MQNCDIAEQNIERLLSSAYQPETVDAAFAQRLEDAMCRQAQDLAMARSVPDHVKYRTLRRRLGWAMAAAACVALCALVLYARRGPVHRPVDDDVAGDQAVIVQPTSPAFGMTPRPRPATVPAKPLTVGERIATKAGERRRVTLADGSILYLNENSTIVYRADRRVDLTIGEVYVEVAPKTGDTFEVKTLSRTVAALGTHFAVRAKPAGTGVLVTQGKVQLGDSVVTAGQQVEPGATNIAAAPRASHALGWTRDLMTAAEAPLVPCSKHAGGRLIAVDPSGQEMHLSMRNYHIDVHIEDGFARTTIDQTYFNHSYGRLEGTFYFPLPADASLSRLAMYVEENGMCRLMEGGMAERDHARNVYETIRHTQRDPALLEWVDGTTFKMRVFPLEGRKEKRIILGYVQRLSSLYGQARYRFPGGHTMEAVRDWSFRAFIKDGARLNISTDPNLQITRDGRDAVLTAQAKNIKPDRDVTLEIRSQESGVRGQEDPTRFSTFTHEGADYLMIRHRPALKSEPRKQRRHWVVLFESSSSRNPLLARAQIDLFRYLLLNAEHDDTFSLVTAGTRTTFFDETPRAATPENIAAAVKFLEGTHLVGALDMDAALQAAAPLLKIKNQNSQIKNHLVHIGGGIATMGETRDEVLASRLPAGTRYVGIGVGKRWNRNFMKLAAERTAGYYRQVTPDESLAWHGFDLVATLNTPRLMQIKVVDNAEQATFLTEANMISQGEEICAIARIDRAKPQALPESITITGQLDGQRFTRVLKVGKVAGNAGYLPRAWAKLELDRLIADGADKHKPRIIELSKASYVMSPFTSLLVLETDADYQRFKVDRGRKDHWAMYFCPERIPIVYEPSATFAENTPKPAKVDGKRAAKEVLQSIQVRVPGQRTTAWDVCTATHIGSMDHLVDIDEYFDGDAAIMRMIGIRNGDTNAPLLYLPAPGGLGPIGQGGTIELETLEAAVDEQTAGRLRRMPLAGAFYGRSGALRDAGRVRNQTQELLIRLREEEEIVVLRDSRRSGLRVFATLKDLESPALRERNERLLEEFLKDPRSDPALMEYANGIEFFPPALGLIVRAPNRIHTSFTGGLIGGRYRRPPHARKVAEPYQMLMSGFYDRIPTLEAMTRIQKRLATTYYHRMEPAAVAMERYQWLDTSRKVFDLETYVQHNTPQYQEKVLKRIQTTAANDISSGKALNGLLDEYLKTRGKLPLAIPDALSEDLLRHVNVVRASGNVGLLRDGGRFQWPAAFVELLTAADREQAERLSRTLFEKAANGKVPEPLLRELRVATKRAQDSLVAKVNDIPTGQYIEAKRFLNDFNDAILAFSQGEHVQYFAFRKWIAEGRTTRELADYMMMHGLKFAPAVSGDEASYRTLFEALAALTVHEISSDDLAGFAPGLNTSLADIHAVLEAEADGFKAASGTIDDRARKLIERARGAGWQAIAIPGHARPYDYTVRFDGAGRCSWTRLLPNGLRESVSCDGNTLEHRYPEIGLGAKRKVSRFHRTELAQVAPWLLPPAEDLARGAHVTLIDTSTVAIVPRKPAGEAAARDGSIQIHLVFCDGRLSERRMLAMPERKVVYREIYDADGAVTWIDGENKKIGDLKLAVRPAHAPETETAKLVWMRLPLRTNDSKQLEETKLASLDVDAKDGFVQRLIGFRQLWRHWNGGQAGKGTLTQVQAERRRLLEFVKDCPALFAWPLLQAGQRVGASDPTFQRGLAEAYAALSAEPGLEYRARYEQARCLASANLLDKARDVFEKLYVEAARDGALPPIDAAFRTVLLGDGRHARLMRQTAGKLATDKRPFGLLTLAWENLHLGDREVADEIAARALCCIGEEAKPFVALGVIPYLVKTEQIARADALMQEVVKEKGLKLSAGGWRLAQDLARRQGSIGRAAEYLQKAMEIEYRAPSPPAPLPEGEGGKGASPEGEGSNVPTREAEGSGLIDLQKLRADFGQLLNLYHQQALALGADAGPAKAFIAKVVRAADRWRELDNDPTQACQLAAKILQVLGDRELAWDYLTTPIDQRPNEAAPWLDLARQTRDSDFDLTDRAFGLAFRAEATNAQILWDHARFLQAAGHGERAQQLYRQIADGDWQPRFQSLKSLARGQLSP
ncbi:MAG: hypothetical protein FJ271_12345 [Planctomycetes bacterium]|nr:hypothetical protein [Planctomycetota bacterium]